MTYCVHPQCGEAIERWYDKGWVHTGTGREECDDTYLSFASPGRDTALTRAEAMTLVPRDPARIDVMCTALAGVWKRYPDYRLGQLIVNVSQRKDPFNLEDDAMLRALQAYGTEGEMNADKDSS
jgi:hypothetical protein